MLRSFLFPFYVFILGFTIIIPPVQSSVALELEDVPFLHKIIRTSPVTVEGSKKNGSIKTERIVHKYGIPTKKRCILSLDGGGVRGVFTVQLLIALERHLKEELQGEYNLSDFRLSDTLDMVAGTSIGGILALGLNAPSIEDPNRPFSLGELEALFDDEGHRIFPKGLWQSARNIYTLWGLRRPKYNRNGIDSVLNEYFGDHLITETQTNVFVTTVDTDARKMRRLNSWTMKENKQYQIKEAAACTSAAPTIFKTKVVEREEVASLKGADGGIVANNPVELAVAKCRDLFPGSDYLIISMGTGKEDKSIPWNLIRFGGAIHWIYPLISSILDITQSINDQNMEEISGLHIHNTQAVTNITRSYLTVLTLYLQEYKQEDTDERLLGEANIRSFFSKAEAQIKQMSCAYDQRPEEEKTIRQRYDEISNALIKAGRETLKETQEVSHSQRKIFSEIMKTASEDAFKLHSGGLDNIEQARAYFRFQGIIQNATIDDIHEIPSLKQAGIDLANEKEEELKEAARLLADEFRYRQAALRNMQEAETDEEDLG